MKSDILKKTSLILVVIFSFGGVFAQDLANDGAQTNAVPLTNSLSYLEQLEPKVFQTENGLKFGFETTNLRKNVPSAVRTSNRQVASGKNSSRTVQVSTIDLESLIPILVGSINELKAEVETLKAEVQSLRAK